MMEYQLPERARTVFEVIKSRRSIRDFDDREIPDELLRIVLEAGIWAPSGTNLQPWEFVLIKDKSLVEKIKLFSPGLFGKPAAIIVVCINRKIVEKAGKLGELMSVMDVSMAAQNIMLMAHAMDLGSCPVASFNKAALRELLDLPDHVDPMLMITLGYRKESPEPPKRRSLEEVVHVNGF